MWKSGILLGPVVLVLALLAMGGVEAQQQQRGGLRQPAQCEGPDCEVRPRVRNVRAIKRAKPAPAPAPQAKKKPLERTPYTEQEAEAAIVPGLPGVRF